MLNVFKKLFSKSEETPKTATPAPATPSPSSAAAAAASAARPAAPAPTPAGTDGVKITVKSIMPSVPDLAKSKMVRDILATDVITLPRGEVLSQLASGAVKITFLDLTRRAPGIFADPDPEMGARMITLPLQEILPQIKQLPRRQGQKVVEIPTDLEQVFGPGGKQKEPVAAPPSGPELPRTSVSTAPAPAPNPAPAKEAAQAAVGGMPQPRPVPKPPPPAPLPVPPPAPPAPAQTGEGYAAPAPKPLPTQESIKFALPGQTSAPAPTAPPAPPPPPTPVAAPLPIRPTMVSGAGPAPVSATDGPVIAFGDIFGQPSKKDWTAQEVADKAAGLRGVAGAIITTGNGLPVAFHLPAELSGNLVAAFVPQMYTRIVQYTRDLKLGEAKNLTILIDNVPLQIFKTGSVFFTVLGKAGENLPKPQLTAIATALGRQNP